MARIIVVTSGKGGAGKTTVTANLGVKLAEAGERVALIDLDFGLNNLSVVLGAKETPPYDLGDVASGRCRARQALFRIKEAPGVSLLSSDGKSCNAALSGEKLRLMVSEIACGFDYVLIDCPAGIDSGFSRAVTAANEAIVVVNPSDSSIKDASRVGELLRSFDIRRSHLVVNRLRGDFVTDGVTPDEKKIEADLKIKLLGVIPEEDAVFLSSGLGKLPKGSPSERAYKLLAANLIRGQSKIFDVTEKYTGFLGSIRKILKKSV